MCGGFSVLFLWRRSAFCSYKLVGMYDIRDESSISRVVAGFSKQIVTEGGLEHAFTSSSLF